MDAKNEKRVLLIGGAADSDEPKALADAGYTVDTARSMDEAAKKLAAQSYSRVLIEPSALARLVESEEIYRNLVERSNDGVVVLQDQLIKLVNPCFEHLSGYSSETLLNTPFTDYLTPEEIAALLERYGRRMAGEYVPSIYETAMTRRGGRKIPLEISAAVVPFQGRPADLVLVRDITERKRAEAVLDEERRRLRAVLGALPVAVLITDAGGRFVGANEQAVIIWGGAVPRVQSMEQYGKLKGWWTDSGEPIAPEEWAMSRALTKGETSIGEVIDIEWVDGNRRTVLNSAAPIRDADGRITGGVVVQQDITSHRELGRRVVDQAATLQVILETVPVGVLMADSKTREVVFASRGARAVFGEHVTDTAASPTRGSYQFLLMDGSPYPPDELPLMRSLRGERVSNAEILVRRSDGSEVMVTANSAPVYDADGHITAAVASLDDITELVKLRRELERSLEDSKRESRRIAAIERIAEAGLASLDIQTLLNVVVEQVANAMFVDSSCVFVLDEELRVFEAYAAYNAPEMLKCRVGEAEGLADKVAQEGHPIYIADARHDPLTRKSCVKRAGIKSLLAVPLIARGRVAGVIYAQSKRTRLFTDEEFWLMRTISDRLALAIDNAKLYDALQRSRSDVEQTLEKERGFSLLLQRALLPAEPTIGEGYDVVVRYVPVFVAREIGGDFYDVFAARDGSVGILIGDVSGKGLEAASIAATTRSTVHAFVHETLSAGEALSRANSVLHSQQPSAESFVTVFLVTLDLSTGQFRYSSASHPPAAILRADGTVGFLAHGENLPLGILESRHYEQSWERLNPGDKLLLYTDGITEAHAGPELFDLEGIERTLAGHSGWSAGEGADNLIAAATEWAEGKLRDDAAVVVIERCH